MVRRYELSDEVFNLLEDLLPVNGKRGGQWNDHRTTPERDLLDPAHRRPMARAAGALRQVEVGP